MGSKSQSAPPGVPRTAVLLPGFLVRGTVCVPAYPPHVLWWAAYSAALLRGASLSELLATPPWPAPPDALLSRQLVYEMIEAGWLLVDWPRGTTQVRADLVERFASEGDEGLLQEARAERELGAEWWLDAVGGTFLRRETAGQFDHDFRPLRPETLQPPPRINSVPGDVDLFDLLGKLRLDPAERRKARLRGMLEITERKDLLFQVFGARDRLLPPELSALAPGLSCYAPELLRPPRAAGRASSARGPSTSQVVRPAPAIAAAGRGTGPAARAPDSAAADTGPSPSVHVPLTQDPLLTEIFAEMVAIPAGTFLMGDGRVPSERPRHRVTISRPFWLGRHPVTQDLWQRVMGRLPHLTLAERGPRFPIIHVGYREMEEFLRRVNQRPGGGGFALPTEAEWEYACRAGSDGDYCFGNDPAQLGDYAWYGGREGGGNSGGRLHEVGQKRMNRFGLHDVHGLVYETVRDGRRPYSAAPVTDPIGPAPDPAQGISAVARGGAWTRFPFDRRNPENEHFRCASRQVHSSDKRNSFRLAWYGGLP